MLLTSFLTVAVAAASVKAQNTTSIYVEEGVPTGTPHLGIILVLYDLEYILARLKGL